jgi:hypothetical protein
MTISSLVLVTLCSESLFETGGATVFRCSGTVFGEGNRENLLDDVGNFYKG